MRALAGQAARHGGRVLHALMQVALLMAVLAAAGAGLLTWRLSAAPLELPWLARQLEAAANADLIVHIGIGGAALTWEGFRAGTDQALDIRVSGVTISDHAGHRLLSVPRAEVALSPARLLLGQFVPRAIVLDGVKLRAIRAADGTAMLDLGSLTDATAQSPETGGGLPVGVLRELARPAARDAAPQRSSSWSQLQRLRIRDAAIAVDDRALGVVWRVPDLGLFIHRLPEGGLAGEGGATVNVGGQSAKLTLTGTLAPGTNAIAVSAALTAINPAKLAAAFPSIPALAALDAPLTLTGSLQLDGELKSGPLSLRAEIGAGTVFAGTGHMPLLGATITAEGTPDKLQVQLLRLETAPRPDGPRTVIKAHADLTRPPAGPVQAAVVLDLDRIAFADLPAIWPEGTGGPGTRPWITKNITEGTAHDGHIELGLEFPADFSDAKLTRVAGGITGDGVSVYWLRPVPPIERADAKLTFTSPDVIDIAITGGRQAGGQAGGIQIQAGHLTFTGLAGKDQFIDVQGDLSGPVTDLLAVLRHPKVKLLDRSPLKLQDAAGQIAGKLTLTRLPLRDAITMDDVNIRTTAKLTGLHLAGIAAAHDLDNGALTLDASPDGLHVSGTAEVLAVPATLQLDMDFRHGSAAQVVQKIAASATLDDKQMKQFGLDTQGILTGPAAVSATLALQRGGHGEATVRADLGKAVLTLEKLGFTKPAGQPATLDARVLLDGDKVSAIDRVRVDGAGIKFDGDLGFDAGQPAVAHVRKLTLGSTIDAQGDVHLPHGAGEPYIATLSGRSFDATAELTRGPPQPERIYLDPKRRPEPPPGPPFLVDAKFDRVVLGPGRQLGGVALHVENDGRITTRAKATGQTGDKAPFQLAIEPQASGRVLTGSATDAGALLRALDVVSTMQGGKLTLIGTYDDSNASHLLTGTAQIDEFRIRNAPILARLLQAVTLYGLVELTKGPGLGFTKLEAPFHYGDDVLDLSDARAFSPSLGMTAKGRVDLARQTADLQGTIVPAYFFNSLLGDIPLIGRLFSPERGGGLLAATYTVRGKLDDPSIGVNPLAALTPGVLRKLFGIFDQPSTPAK